MYIVHVLCPFNRVDPVPSTPCALFILHRILSSAGKDLKGSVFLEALAAREEPNRNGKMTVSLGPQDISRLFLNCELRQNNY